MGNHDAAVKDSGVVASRTEYAAYGLNRHASVGDFVPQFDADGNQTLLKTETAVWLVDYNAENRPVRFARVEGTITTVHCEYDYMGRRATKTVTVNNNVTLHQRYIYRGYLQIAALDLTRAAHPAQGTRRLRHQGRGRRQYHRHEGLIPPPEQAFEQSPVWLRPYRGFVWEIRVGHLQKTQKIAIYRAVCEPTGERNFTPGNRAEESAAPASCARFPGFIYLFVSNRGAAHALAGRRT